VSKSSSTTVLCNFCPKAVKEKEPKGESPRWRLQNKRALFATSLATRLPACPPDHPPTLASAVFVASPEAFENGSLSRRRAMCAATEAHSGFMLKLCKLSLGK
jgi:hypothetical protein